ncbi:copper chaperone PCu(A)C [Bartonella sp. DGB1]|uniref:copper chaperone PCu(A)C n=1 Tax=Bartonella sp. DGB1 TaxID=3239807 RepID=UPI0035267379
MFLKRVLIALIALLFCINTANAHSPNVEYKFGDLVISNPVINEPLTSSKVTAGYMKIRNLGTKDEYLIDAFSDIAQSVMIHNMVVRDGAMKMVHMKNGLKIPAGKEVILKRGSYHIMFEKLNNNNIKAGEKVKVGLKFSNLGVVTIDFDVRTNKRQHNKNHKHHHHH